MSTGMHRYFIRLAYDGTNFHGWQLQNGVVTVQEVLNEALSKILRYEINVVGCGRTDTGVHASEFYAHFELPDSMKLDIDHLIFKLNSFLDKSIAIYNIYKVGEKDHTRFSALSRTYQYYVLRSKDPFKLPYAYYYFGDLDMEQMNKAAAILFEYEDFTSFSKSGTQVKTNICRMMYAQWEEKDNQLIFTIQADRFLRNMVRAVVGTLLEVGQGKMSLNEFRQVIESKDRSEAGYSVPARGLFLTKIEYPKAVFAYL